MQGAASADGLTLRAPSLALRLGGAQGRAEVTLLLSPPASLTLRASLGQITAGAWMDRLMRDLLHDAAHSAFAADIDVGAGALGTRTTLMPSPAPARAAGTRHHAGGRGLDHPSGGTRLSASGTVGQAGLTGELALQGESLHTTLDWLAGGPIGAPPSVLARADLHGPFSASASRLAWTALNGTLDGSPITGSMAVRPGARPALELALTTPRLPLAAWAWPPAATVPALADILAPFGRADATIRLAADRIDWPGLTLRYAVLDAAGTQDGVALHRLALDVPGGHLEAAGTLGADGALTDGRLDLAAQDAAALPAAWRVPAGLWQGGFHWP